jgi:hypothetical protein
MSKVENQRRQLGLVGDGWMITKKKVIHVKNSKSLGPFKKQLQQNSTKVDFCPQHRHMFFFHLVSLSTLQG